MGNAESGEFREVARKLGELQKKQEEEDKKLEKQREFKWNASVSYTWSIEEEERLRKEILTERKDSLGKKIKMKILVFGLSGHGKSTLLNGFRSALLGESMVSHYHQAGSSGIYGTYTKGFCAARYGEFLTLIDIGGIYESKSFKDSDIEDIINGRVPFYAKLTEHLEVKDMKEKGVPKAGKYDIACVLMVMKPGTELGPQTRRLFQVIDSLVREGCISRRLVLTHMDQIDPSFIDPTNIPKFVQSGKVQEAVKMMTEETGIPPSATNFVRNYVKETHTNMYSNILLLKALESIIFDAKDNHERLTTRKQMEESDTDSD